MCMCVYVSVHIHICIFLRSVFSFLSLVSFLFCAPYSCLPTVSLEVDVQTLKPPGAKPLTGKYVRVGYNSNNNNIQIKKSSYQFEPRSGRTWGE